MQNEKLKMQNGRTKGEQEPRDSKERTFNFSLQVIRFCQRLNRSSVEWTRGKQLLRSATSIGANVEEAQAAQSRADFVNKLAMALKEARETHSWLRLLAASRPQGADHVTGLQNEASELKRVLGAIIVAARRPGR